jgi:hypothetical protein
MMWTVFPQCLKKKVKKYQSKKMTQRTPVTYKKLRRIFPIISWKTCDKCKNEFRREIGFKAIILFIHLKLPFYLCKLCAPNRQTAHGFFNAKGDFFKASRKDYFFKVNKP